MADVKERKLTKAQMQQLARVAKRDWPVGEPRLRWLHKSSARVLWDGGYIVERPGTESKYDGSCIVDLTPAGRLALSQEDRT